MIPSPGLSSFSFSPLHDEGELSTILQNFSESGRATEYVPICCRMSQQLLLWHFYLKWNDVTFLICDKLLLPFQESSKIYDILKFSAESSKIYDILKFSAVS
ncbi:hypothetical protein IEQ34_008060 [Dendrobium chrysotoxum]|uniref:Uncharacterized protein n=1 Tax=Dendrobium chrysotoxum TaxID=161865 RepID=A0AAV7H7A2_DENCH|nr:hypothetical protein IEQ34_008060 [Dendrobium chrysotoxum]